MVRKMTLVPGKGPVQNTGPDKVLSSRGERVRRSPSGYDVGAKLREVLDNPNAPPQARAAAGRTLAEMAGLIGRHQAAPDRGASVPVGQLSRADLVSELERLRTKTQANP